MMPRPRLSSLSLRTLGSIAISCATFVTVSPALADPAPRECASASEDALKLRKQERFGAAKERLLVCTAASCPAEIRDECGRRLGELTAAMPSVVFDVKDAQGGDLTAVRVSVDGVLLVDHVGAGAVEVDPGQHTFRFEAAGQTIDKQALIREGEKSRPIQVSFGTSPQAGAAPGADASPPPPSASSTTATPAAAADAGRATSPSSWQKPAAVVIAGLGVVGIGVGTAFGLQAFSKWSDAKNACTSAACTLPGSSAESLKSDATNAATVSTVLFGVGAAALVTGAVLWFTAPSGVQVAPSVGGMTVRGVF
jgi:hypothetical protein